LKQKAIQNIVAVDSFMCVGKELTRENEVEVEIPKRMRYILPHYPS